MGGWVGVVLRRVLWLLQSQLIEDWKSVFSSTKILGQKTVTAADKRLELKNKGELDGGGGLQTVMTSYLIKGAYDDLARGLVSR